MMKIHLKAADEWYPWYSQETDEDFFVYGDEIEADTQMVERLSALQKEAKEVQEYFRDLWHKSNRN